MDRNDIVKTFLESGYQIATDALSYFESNPEKIQEFLNLALGKLEKPIVTQKTIEQILSGISPKVKVIKSFFQNQKQRTVDDLSNQLTERYQKIMEVLSKRIELINPISINRISQQNKKFSVIAMVKEVNSADRSLVIEDPTGTTSVYVGDEAVGDLGYLLEDEVVGLVCDNEESSDNRAVKIVFPDIPLATKISTSSQEIFCIFISDIHMDEPGFMPHSLEKLTNYLNKIKEEAIVFVLGDVSTDKEKTEKFVDSIPKNMQTVFLRGELDPNGNKNFLPDPVIVDVSGVRIFLSHGKMFTKYFEKFKTSPEMVILQLIKKRHMSPTFKNNINLDEEKLFIDQVPDIFVIGHFHDPRTINYKGTTIIALGSFVTQPIFWGVNLKTRESIKIDLT